MRFDQLANFARRLHLSATEELPDAALPASNQTSHTVNPA
jgi:hypothetical protein